MMKRSLMVPGSLSSALQTTYFSLPGALRTISHLLPVGKPAPPMPRSPAALRVAITALQSGVSTNCRTTEYLGSPP